MALEPPLYGEAERTVTEEWTAVRMGSGTVPVLATPALVAVMEEAAVRALEGHLPPGQTSVGVRIDVRHLAATPLGMRVRACATLVSVEGRRLTFRIEAWDDREKVGEADHERVLVDVERFLARVREK
ncbi:MAG: thioesterase family protein [Anaerolineae bacterium]|nr:thioesterase family protein [Anaerolineae bacterium]MCX8066829.1 thioesterase family protein [Anaerolineae bacterium]MDW7990580.1 thioesterase family protein [Anaerolineae bacterium]